ncbi:MAG: hypothetical protein EOO01_08600 [Chitinophagaceae bacterium]|nr:MAG: hypothetical protein EOO01_08600 [Chitinophagaceae bacterium]
MYFIKKYVPIAVLIISFSLYSCREQKDKNATAPQQSSYIVSDSLRAWCKAKMPAARILSEGETLKLLFFEEELPMLWKPPYSEDAVKELAKKDGFVWEEMPAHEGNRRWSLSLTLQPEDSTYLTPNNLLVYLFR